VAKPREAGIVKTILLGAGASVEAGVPAAKELARKIYEAARQFPDLARAAEVAIGGLRSHRSIAHEDPFGDVDIEDLYQVLRLLAERSANPLAPFVGAWSHATTAAERTSNRHVADRMVGALAEGLSSFGRARSDSATPLGELTGTDLSRLRHVLEETLAAGASPRDSAFSACAAFVLKRVVQASWIQDSTRVSYLNALLLSSHEKPIWIASLNYDNALERASEALEIPLDIGVASGSSSVNFSLRAQVSLAKLHGSANWFFSPQGVLQVLGAPMELRTAMIFGSGNKLQVNGPYLDLLFAFRSRLDRSQVVEVCGYSFRDQHVNHLLLAWLGAEPTRHLDVFDPHLTEAEIEKNVAQSMPPGWRLSSGTLGSQLRINAMTASQWAARYQNV
jgi:hypothetical protein